MRGAQFSSRMNIFCQIVLGLLVISKISKADFRDEALEAHNKLRETHHVPPFTRNTTLDKYAQDTADWLAKNLTGSMKKFYNRRNGNYGENNYGVVSTTVSDSKAVQMAIDMWYGAKKDYDYNNPEVIKSRAGQFTQLVWKNSKSIGIGVARSSSTTFVSVDYDPPGNYRESYPENVFKP